MDVEIDLFKFADQVDDLGRLAYKSYAAVTDGKNFQGNPMPEWSALPATIRAAWVSAACAVAAKTAVAYE